MAEVLQVGSCYEWGWRNFGTQYGVTRPQRVNDERSVIVLSQNYKIFEIEYGYHTTINTLRPRQNGRHFPDDIFKCIFLFENVWIWIKISFKFVPKVRNNNIPALAQIMAWRRIGDKPLSEPMMVNLLTYICVTRPQWVNAHLCARGSLHEGQSCISDIINTPLVLRPEYSRRTKQIPCLLMHCHLRPQTINCHGIYSARCMVLVWWGRSLIRQMVKNINTILCFINKNQQVKLSMINSFWCKGVRMSFIKFRGGSIKPLHFTQRNGQDDYLTYLIDSSCTSPPDHFYHKCNFIETVSREGTFCDTVQVPSSAGDIELN